MTDEPEQPVEVVLHCRDLAANQAFFAALGFGLDSVFPADDPRQLRLSGHGLHLCLQRGPDGGGQLRLLGKEGAAQIAPNGALIEFARAVGDIAAWSEAPKLVVTTAAAEWIDGRAGMRYLDLIPGRCGGRVIASRIRIERGGPVPDYVHHHDVAAQLIYCRAGWVRVVYEDQGPPFVMVPGDCVVQPKGICHRVLECSDGMEVIEVSAPAEHVTYVARDLALPTAELRPERRFGGQRFVCDQVQNAQWANGGAQWPKWEVRATGIGAATAGELEVVVRRAPAADLAAVDRGDQLRLWYVLAGAAEFTGDGQCLPMLADAACLVPASVQVGWRAVRAPLELLEVRLSGEVVTADQPARKS